MGLPGESRARKGGRWGCKGGQEAHGEASLQPSQRKQRQDLPDQVGRVELRNQGGEPARRRAGGGGGALAQHYGPKKVDKQGQRHAASGALVQPRPQRLSSKVSSWPAGEPDW